MRDARNECRSDPGTEIEQRRSANKQEELMNRRKMRSTLGRAVLAGSLFTVAAAGQPGNSDKTIPGETAVVAGSEISTWARVNGAGHVTWVGLTMPLALVENMPPEGTIAVLNYP